MFTIYLKNVLFRRNRFIPWQVLASGREGAAHYRYDADATELWLTLDKARARPTFRIPPFFLGASGMLRTGPSESKRL